MPSHQDAHAGAELRLVDVSDGTRAYRAFGNVQGMTGQEFHRRLSEAVTRHYGHLGASFIEQLLALKGSDTISTDFNQVKTLFQPTGAQAGRVAERFSLAAFAGELAIKFKLITWKKGTAASACQTLFNEWLEYADSQKAIDKILEINPHLQERSIPVKLTGIERNREYETTVFHLIGFLLIVMESG